MRLKVSLSRKLRGQDWACLGPTPPLLHTLSLRAGQDSNPPTPALSLSRAPSRWAFAQGSLSLPGAWRLGHQDKLYFFGSRTLLVSLFCIKKKQIKYVFVFTVYLLYSSYLGLDIFIFLRGGWGRVGKGSQKEVYQKSTQKNPQKNKKQNKITKNQLFFLKKERLIKKNLFSLSSVWFVFFFFFQCLESQGRCPNITS